MFIKNLTYLMRINGTLSNASLARNLDIDLKEIEGWFEGVRPSVDSALKLSDHFMVGVDELLTLDLIPNPEIYSEIRAKPKKSFRYVSYSVISRKPEQDALTTVRNLAKMHGVTPLAFIGWDFPFISPEQETTFNMRGYTAAYIIDDGHPNTIEGEKFQEAMDYITLTVTKPDDGDFNRVIKGHQILQQYQDINHLDSDSLESDLRNYEYYYNDNGVEKMDINIAISKKTA